MTLCTFYPYSLVSKKVWIWTKEIGDAFNIINILIFVNINHSEFINLKGKYDDAIVFKFTDILIRR